VTAILDKLLVKPSLVNLPPIQEGGLQLVSLGFINILHLKLQLKQRIKISLFLSLILSAVSKNSCSDI
jgi:hypothetical protein